MLTFLNWNTHTREKKKKLHTLSNKTIRWIRLSKGKTTLLITKWWLISLVANKSSRRFCTPTLAIKTMSIAMRVQNFYHHKASWGEVSRLLLYIMYLSNPCPSRGRLISEIHTFEQPCSKQLRCPVEREEAVSFLTMPSL